MKNREKASKVHDKLINLMADMMEEEALSLVNELIRANTDPLSILEDARSAMELVGKRFETGEYSIPYLMMAGEILKEVSAVVKPRLDTGSTDARKGKVLIGTVAGDIHDIGKDIVTFMLDVNGYEVLDIGIDVPVQGFVDEIRGFRPQVVGLSGFLTLAYDSMKKTVEALERAGLRDPLKIMIGGGQMDDEVRKYVRADGYGKDAVAALQLCRQWIRG
jgi:trimethylamine corrinoid protein